MYKLAFVLGMAIAANAQEAPDKDFKIINDKLDRLIKLLDDADQAPPSMTAKVTIGDAPVLGDDKAPITIVEFTDFQCPFCQRFHIETFPKLRDQYISTGKVRFVSRDLPLSIHPNAAKAAEAGRCAGEQGHFWEMRDWMQSNPNSLSSEDLTAYGIGLGINLNQFRLCMASAKYREAVRSAIQEATNLHITGTPTFVVGKSGAVIDGQLLLGAVPFATIEKAILGVK